MDAARIAELLQPFLASGPCCKAGHSVPARSGVDKPADLSPAQLQSISTYIDLLLRWNARINLTAIRDPEEIVTRHFGESLFAARLLFPVLAHGATDAPVRAAEQSSAVASTLELPTDHGRARGRAALEGRAEDPKSGALAPVAVADLGSGAGFPGVPIKLWAPHVSLTLIESNHKKATFLREAARALTLTNVNVLTCRAEELLNRSSGSPASFDIVTLRAVERFEAILPIASSLVAPQGRLVLLIGSAQVKPALAALPSLSWDNPVPVPLSRSRVVAVAQR